MSAKAVVKICDMPPDMLDSASPAVDTPNTSHHNPALSQEKIAQHCLETENPCVHLCAMCCCVPCAASLPCAAALTETEYAFLHLNTEKEVAQAVRNAFVKKVRHIPWLVGVQQPRISALLLATVPNGAPSWQLHDAPPRAPRSAHHAADSRSPHCLRRAVQRGVALLCGAQLRGVHDPRAGARSTLEQAAKSGAARSPPAFLARPRACDSRSTPVSRLRSLALVV